MVGDAICKIRKKKKITQYRLAKDSGISQSHIQRIERGEVENPTWGLMCKIADALGVSLDTLAGRNGKG